MKKVKVLEYLSIGLIVFLASLMTFGFVLGSGGTDTGGTSGGTNYTFCSPYGLVSPATNAVSGKVEVSACVPWGTTGGTYHLLDSASKPVRLGSMLRIESTTGKMYFTPLDTTGLPAGTYKLQIFLYGAMGGPSSVQIEPKLLQVNIPTMNPPGTITNPTGTTGTSTTTPTTNTGGTSTGTTTNTTTTATEITPAVIPATLESELTIVKSITVGGTQYSGDDARSYIAGKIAEIEKADLPADMKVAPVTLFLSTEKSEISELNDTKTKGKVRLFGKAEPNTKVWLYIYSDPIVVSVTTDANGDWTYNLDQDLNSGQHEVYVAMKDDAGKVKSKSLPFTFFVGEAVAASTGTESTVKASPNYALYYMIIAFSVLALTVSGLFFLVTKKHIRKHVEATQDQL